MAGLTRAGFNVQDFVSNIQNNGVLQTNKFIVEIPMPGIFVSNPNTLELIRFRANRARVPGVTLETTPVHRYGIGPTQKQPTNVNFTDDSITFLDDSLNTIWKFLYDWINGVFQFTDPLTPSMLPAAYTLNYKMDDLGNSIYVVDILVHVFDNQGKNTTTTVLKQAYPISLNDVALSWGDNNTLLETTATFAFADWYELNYGTYTGAPIKNTAPSTGSSGQTVRLPS